MDKIRDFVEGNSPAGKALPPPAPALAFPRLARPGDLPAPGTFAALHAICSARRTVSAHQGMWNVEYSLLCRNLASLLPPLMEALQVKSAQRKSAKKHLEKMHKKLKECKRLSQKRQRRWNGAAVDALNSLLSAHQGLDKGQLARAGTKEGTFTQLKAAAKNAEQINRKAGRGLRRYVSRWVMDQRSINRHLHGALEELVDIHTRLRASLARDDYQAAKTSAGAVQSWMLQQWDAIDDLKARVRDMDAKRQETHEQFTIRFLQEARSASPLVLPAKLMAECSRTAAHLYGASGPLARQGLWFNEPVVTATDAALQGVWLGTHERIVERFWVMSHLARLPLGSRVMDAGCAGSTLSLELASSGYAVAAVDQRSYGLHHPNLKSHLCDVCDLPFPDGHFDAAIFLSTLESLGAGTYGMPRQAGRDAAALAEAARVLKAGGFLFITTPYGVRPEAEVGRTHDRDSLAQLLEGFQIVDGAYAIRRNAFVWERCDDEAGAARQARTAEGLPGAMAMIVAQKK